MAIEILAMRAAAESMALEQLTTNFAIPLILIIVLIIFLKGTALFKAARLNEKVWFWVLVIFNTAGILELVYLFIRRKKKI